MSRPKQQTLHHVVPFLSFAVAIVLAFAGNPSLRVLARQAGSPTGPAPLIKVTHIIFNHDFSVAKQGPPTRDALSIRFDWDFAQNHGPYDNDEVPVAEAGAGEWIVDPAQDSSRSTRNEAALYLREQTQPFSNNSVLVRFEANGAVADAMISYVPVGAVWPSVVPTKVEFKSKKPGNPLNKYPNPPFGQVSVGTAMPESYFEMTGISSDEYVGFRYAGTGPNDVHRTLPQFLWFATDIHLKDGTTVSNMTLNLSGLPTADPGSTTGHELFTILDTPRLPWYETSKLPFGPDPPHSKRTHPWVIALREVTKRDFPEDAQGATTLEQAGAGVTSYLFRFKGLTYDTVRGASQYVRNRTVGNREHWDIHLQRFIRLQGLPPPVANPSQVDCYDMAGTVQALFNLVGGSGIFHYKGNENYGYLRPQFVVGIHGLTNNPFSASGFYYPDTTPANAQLLPEGDFSVSRIFANHAYVIHEDRVYDACVGPETGTLTELQHWVNTIDVPLSLAWRADPRSAPIASNNPNGNPFSVNWRPVVDLAAPSVTFDTKLKR